MKIWYVASEAAPFMKTGGLADVIGSLPQAVSSLGEDVSVVMPKYGSIAQEYVDEMEYLFDLLVPVGWRKQFGAVLKLERDGITYYFIDNEYYFNREGVLYGHYDDAERFAFFSRAVLEMIGQIEEVPDVLHCHDWQTGVVPAFLRIHYQHIEAYQKIRTVFTIHNLQYQGIFPEAVLGELLQFGHEHFTAEGIQHNGLVNYMKAGIVHSDQITTVSPSYRDEIMEPYYGEGLDAALRHRAVDVRGILNGLDLATNDPSTDKRIAQTYDLDTFKEGKLANKRMLQERYGLEVRDDIMLIGFVSRLVEQKGLDLIHAVNHELGNLDCQFVFLGSGQPEYEAIVHEMTAAHPGKIGSYIGFDIELAHLIYAGSDAFLMPSRFEPCGLSQLISMRYGTLPIVRETGGLRDTVKPYNDYTQEGTGFGFLNYNAHEMLATIEKSIRVFYEDNTWNALVHQAMTSDFSWKQSAKQYRELYHLFA
ncbi:glycogen synthase GlgA [Exiguobacterium sp. SH0S7]|uniref:glycogen synthase GlgA n=1 Tax=Exiguobacterium sp. SH0S7 TaxID=2510951 RepID=UPI00103DC432|nr:glycogen synthase GlgA [Exiguobacterium sp. SH0S7]TCI72340.1 glycogen synthase GlgA [Exiguobacterium sp. SH0S7]